MLNDKVSATNIFNKVVYNNIVFFAFFRRLKMKKESERLNVGDRLQIEAMVSDKNISAQQIANKLKVDKTTIYRELKRNSKHYSGYTIRCYNLPRSGVCNSCKRRSNCEKNRLIYRYRTAQLNSEARCSRSRSFSHLDDETFKIIDDIIYSGTNLGQSLHHIYISNPILKTICSERTIRRMCYRDELRTKPHQLRRYVRYKRQYKKDYKDIKLKNPKVLIGRTFADFNEEIGKSKQKHWVEYDSVIGKKTDKKAILTITLPQEDFQFGLLINKSNPDSVLRQLQKLFTKIGHKYVTKIFYINLADNGIEFSRFTEIEADENGEIVRKTFFTNPYKSTDKAHCERNHEFIRYVIPKGVSMDDLTQDFLDEMFSNINSYVRKSKNNLTPYELVEKKYGKEFLDLINIKKIDKRKVKLTAIA